MVVQQEAVAGNNAGKKVDPYLDISYNRATRDINITAKADKLAGSIKSITRYNSKSEKNTSLKFNTSSDRSLY